jgi:hypothetical protein
MEGDRGVSLIARSGNPDAAAISDSEKDRGSINDRSHRDARGESANDDAIYSAPR